MAIDKKEIIVFIRKSVIFSIKTWSRSLSDHPLIWVMVFCTLLVYWFLPTLFAFLISSAPVIACTALLLGTLLSFGNPNIPEVEEEEKGSHIISALKVNGAADSFIVEKDASFLAETHGERGGETDASSSFTLGSEINESATKDEKEICSDERELHKDKLIVDGAEVDEKQESSFIEQMEEINNQLENHEDSSQVSTWKEIEDQDVSSDSDSHRAVSSSPDASMTDIALMLDELHPLLDPNASNLAHKSLERSNGAPEESFHCHESDNSGEESAEGEDKEEAQEDGAADVVTWTENDEKSLKDIKNSELERNRKMENLMAKRIAYKNLKSLQERNLIDFDIPIQIPPISTTRQNPFDLPYSTDTITGLPPIPSSAPSVLLRRMNSFDVAYDQANERDSSGAMGESLGNQRFSRFQQRHESFTLEDAFPVEIMNEMHEIRMLNPYPVVDRAASEDASSFMLPQVSERSDLKLSSVPQSETISYLADQKEILDQESYIEGDRTSDMKNIEQENQSQTSKDIDSFNIEQKQAEIDLNAVKLSFKGVEEEVEIVCEKKSEVLDKNYSGGFSSSSSSEDNLKQSTHSNLAMQLPLIEVKRVEEVQTAEPVYDSSPSSVEKHFSNISASEDPLPSEEIGGFDPASSVVSSTSFDMAEVTLPPLTDGDAGSFSDRGSVQKDMGSSNEGFSAAASNLAEADEYQSSSRDVINTSQQEVIHPVSSGVQDNIENSVEPVILESLAEPALHVRSLSPLDTEDNPRGSQTNLHNLVHDLDDDEISSKISVLKEILDYRSTSNLVDVNGSDEANEEWANEQDEAVEGTKEIDEGLLSELDVIGDFTVEKARHIALTLDADVVTNSFVHLSVHESLSDVGCNKIELVEGDVRSSESQEPEGYSLELKSHEVMSLEDTDSSFKQIQSAVDSSVIPESIDVEYIVTETNSELEVLEERSYKDLNSSFMQLGEGDSGKSTHESDNEKPLLEESEVGFAEAKKNTVSIINDAKYSEECIFSKANSEMEVLDERSVEDLELAYEQLSHIDFDKSGLNSDNEKLHLVEFGVGSVELEATESNTEAFIDEVRPSLECMVTETNSELEVLEASSTEDLDSAFRQLSHVAMEESVLELENENNPVVEAEVQPVKLETTESHLEFLINETRPSGDSIIVKTNSELEVVEASSIEELDLAFKQQTHGNCDKSVLELDNEKLLLLESVAGTVELEANEIHPEAFVCEIRPSSESTATKIDSDLEVLVASSDEELDLAFKQLIDGSVRRSDLELDNEALQLVEAKVGSTEQNETGRNTDPMISSMRSSDESTVSKTDSELEVIKASSVDEIEFAFNQITAGAIDKSVLELDNEKQQLVESGAFVTKTDSDMEEFEENSVEGLNSAFKQLTNRGIDRSVLELDNEKVQLIEFEVGSNEIEVTSRQPKPIISAMRPVESSVIRTVSELEVLEASSVEELDSAFMKLTQPCIDKPVLELDNEKLQLVQSEVGPIELETTERQIAPTISAMQSDDDSLPTTTSAEHEVLEASFVGELNSASKQLSQGDIDKSGLELGNETVQLVKSEGRCVELEETERLGEPIDNEVGPNTARVTKPNAELEVLELSSVEDVDSAFMQHSHGGIDKFDLASDNERMVESEGGSVELVSAEGHEEPVVNEAKPSEESIVTNTHSEQVVLEARSVDDFESVLESEKQKLQVVEHEVQHVELEATERLKEPINNEMESDEIEPPLTECVVQEDGSNKEQQSSKKSNKEFEEESVSLISTARCKKKEKSAKSGSSSSSSSNSSSSDSD